ncbi:MAG: sugar ABC transporter substrate-binding protein [Treponema sp.]|jgi:inositol transport system substrate-binding protein|nr:sugar ABC transporter substrate-binding protein [Treponema sp.]
MKKTNLIKAAVISILLLSLVLMGGCSGNKDGAGEKKVKVGFCNGNDADFFQTLVKAEFRKQVGSDPVFEVIYTDAGGDSQAQLNSFDTFISQGVNIIVVIPVDTASIVPGIQKANQAKIPVLSISSNSGGGDFTYIGNTYIDGGILQAEYMIKHLPQNAKIVYLMGMPGYDHSRDRRAGFLDTLAKARPDVTVLADQTANYMRDQAMKIMEDWIQSFSQIDGVICANDQMALGALQALKIANRNNGVLIAGVDATDEALQEIEAGNMAMTVLQSAPMLVDATYESLKKLQAGQTLEKRIIIPQVAISSENIDEYLNK